MDFSYRDYDEIWFFILFILKIFFIFASLILNLYFYDLIKKTLDYDYYLLGQKKKIELNLDQSANITKNTNENIIDEINNFKINPDSNLTVENKNKYRKKSNSFYQVPKNIIRIDFMKNFTKYRINLIFFVFYFILSNFGDIFSVFIINQRFNGSEYFRYQESNEINSINVDTYYINKNFFISDFKLNKTQQIKTYDIVFRYEPNTPKNFSNKILKKDFNLSKCHKFSNSELKILNFYYRFQWISYIYIFISSFLLYYSSHLMELLIEFHDSSKYNLYKFLLKLCLIFTSDGIGGFDLLKPESDCLIPIRFFEYAYIINLVINLMDIVYIISLSFYIIIKVLISMFAGIYKLTIQFGYIRFFVPFSILTICNGIRFFLFKTLWFLGSKSQIISTFINLTSIPFDILRNFF